MLTRKTHTNIYFNTVIYRDGNCGSVFYNGQICVEGIICGLFIEIGITFIALFIAYVVYEAIYKG
jgi:hypothetical protein